MTRCMNSYPCFFSFFFCLQDHKICGLSKKCDYCIFWYKVFIFRMWGPTHYYCIFCNCVFLVADSSFLRTLDSSIECNTAVIKKLIYCQDPPPNPATWHSVDTQFLLIAFTFCLSSCAYANAFQASTEHCNFLRHFNILEQLNYRLSQCPDLLEVCQYSTIFS